MAELTVLEYPHPDLKLVSEPVTLFDSSLHQLLEDMGETMKKQDGIGLAAPQVGKRLRAFIVNLAVQEGYQPHRYEIINPVFVEMSGRAVFEEGCLSVPDLSETVKRFGKVKIRYQDRQGTPKELEAEGLLAVAIQHENDHLDGILFFERLSWLKRFFLKRKSRIPASF